GWSPESWYEPRRHELATAFAVIAGVIGAFYAGATRWELLSDPEYSFAWSFAKFQGAIAVGAAASALGGGLSGHAIGAVWERWHRKRRALRESQDMAAVKVEPRVPSAESHIVS